MIVRHGNIALQGHTNYKLHEVKKSKVRLNKTQNLLKDRSQQVLNIYLKQRTKAYINSKFDLDENFKEW